VEKFECHKIASKPIFRSPQSSKRTRTYYACIQGVRLRYNCFGQHTREAETEVS